MNQEATPTLGLKLDLQQLETANQAYVASLDEHVNKLADCIDRAAGLAGFAGELAMDAPTDQVTMKKMHLSEQMWSIQDAMTTARAALAILQSRIGERGAFVLACLEEATKAEAAADKPSAG